MAKLNNVHAVVGILWREDRLLVCERPPGKPYAGFWEFPGGKVELAEESLAALKRELYEELGIEIAKAHFLFQHHYSYPDKNVTLDLWQVTHFIGEPIGQEYQLVRWATLDEIRELNLLEGNWPLLEKLCQAS